MASPRSFPSKKMATVALILATIGIALIFIAAMMSSQPTNANAAEPRIVNGIDTANCDPVGLDPHDGNQTNDRAAVCSESILGVIPGGNQTPSVKLRKPRDGQAFNVDEPIPCKIRFINFEPGLFDGTGKNGQPAQFGLRPFSLGASGNPRGHAHCYIREDDNRPATQLVSFLALNAASEDGETLEGNMPPVAERGTYKLCVDLAGGNHFTFPKGVAQQFPPTDCVTIEVVRRGRNLNRR